MISYFYPVLASVVVAGIASLGRRLNQAVQPLRLELADKGEALLSEDNLSPSARDHVEFLLETAFGMRATMIASMFVLPFAAVILVIRPKWIAALDCVPLDSGAASRLFYLHRLHDRITRANHPFLLPLVEAECALILTPAFVLRSVIDNSISQAVPSVSFATVEEVKAFLARNLGRRSFAVGH